MTQQIPEFILHDFEPAYMQMYRRGELGERVEQALQELEDCCACPRDCHVNRLQDEKRVCNTGRHAIVSSAFPHFGEENCLRGWKGSGTIFSVCAICVACFARTGIFHNSMQAGSATRRR